MTEPAPVLLGRVRAPNNDANKKRISAPQEPAAPAPAPAVVPRGDAQRWRCAQMTWAIGLICLLNSVALSVPLLAGCHHLELGFNEYALMLSTATAGVAAMWTWLLAPSMHILRASYFLLFNWIEGLATLSFITHLGCTCYKTRRFADGDSYSRLEMDSLGRAASVIRLGLLIGEIFALQFLIHDRLKMLLPATRRRCGSYLQITTLCLGLLGCLAIAMAWADDGGNYSLFTFGIYSAIYLAGLVVHLFLAWIVFMLYLLCRTLTTFRRALRSARRENLVDASKSLEVSHRATRAQVAGVLLILITTLVLSGTTVASYATIHGSFSESARPFVISACINLVLNAAGAILLSGAHQIPWMQDAIREPTAFRQAPKAKKMRCMEKGEEWQRKVQELASRGLSLEKLMDFYKMLGTCVMHSFQPGVRTTNDVVRLAIIPLTSSASSSYADMVNDTEVFPHKMVTHNWSNNFRDLLSSVVADALGEHTFEFIAELLSERAGVPVVERMLRQQECMNKTYWICAFAVNQHRGICGSNPRADVDPVTHIPHPVCHCTAPKIFNTTLPVNSDGQSIECEMNKFDDMMAFLAFRDPSFGEVVAVDANLELFGVGQRSTSMQPTRTLDLQGTKRAQTPGCSLSFIHSFIHLELFGRAWCIAELAEAQQVGMTQTLKLRNKEALLKRQQTLQNLKVEEMKASRPEDVEEILSKIPDKTAFNRNVQDLIFDQRFGLLANWRHADALQQMEQASRVLHWIKVFEAVEDGMLIWRRWIA